MDRRRLADVRAGKAGELRSSGSGYLVGQRLVLTCRHVIADGQDGIWPRLEVWLGHPADGPRRRTTATVAWVHPDPAIDAALLRIDGDPATVAGLVRWGWFVGGSPLPYTGLGFPEFADYESGRGVEQLSGTLSPLSWGADGGFVLDQGPAPDPTEGRAWPGISGAAVFCEDLLVAVVVKDDREFGNRRLHAGAISTLVREPGFADLIADDSGTEPVLEPVELAEFLQLPATAVRPRTPGSLLAATAETVEFTGRASELAELAAWRDSGESFSVMLVTGEGGQGKSRLARQFAAQARQAGWAAGFLLVPHEAATTGDDNRPQAAERLAIRGREATRPVLLAVDYAETRAEEITALTDLLASSPLTQPVRILMLSRTAGAWWDDLSEALSPHAARRIALEPLTETGEGRREAYAAAVTGLARHLAALPDSPVEQPSGQPLGPVAANLAAHPPDLDDPRLGNALSLQIAALTNLLAAAAGEEPVAAFGERDLVRHERGYLRRAAVKRGLFDPGVLSKRTDNSERRVEAWQTLDRALAAVILLGTCDAVRARAIGALAADDRAEDVMNWLAALYPSPGEDGGTGAVQPDRLAELLLGPILTGQPGLLDQVGALAQTADDGYQVLATLVRTAAHSDFTHIGEQVVSLIATHSDPFAHAALALAGALPRRALLREGLLRLGKRDPEGFRESVYPALRQLPFFSVSGALLSVTLAGVAAEIVNVLAQEHPGDYLPDLAMALGGLGNRLAAVGRRDEALKMTRQAVTICRWLAEAYPDAYLIDLAMSLNDLGNRLNAVGQREEAFASAQEAVEICRRLAEASPDVYLPQLAIALGSLGGALTAVGRREEALVAAQEAVMIRRQLAEAIPDKSLPDLAHELNNLGLNLADVGRRGEALAAAREAVEIDRRLAEAIPDTYLPNLAHGLNNLGLKLADVGRVEEALAAAWEAVEIYRRLAEALPDAYLSDLAGALNNLSLNLADVGRREEALAVAREAVEIYRRLAEALPDAYLPVLAGALDNLGNRLTEAGKAEEALALTQEAVEIYRRLAEALPDAYFPDLAGALDNLGNELQDVGKAEEALALTQEAVEIYRRLAEALPDAYFPDLAGALDSLGSKLADVGRASDGLPATQEALTIRRRLAEDNPDAHLPYLAGTLNNLGLRLAALGHGQEALVVTQEAAETYRQLAEVNPDAHLPGLAISLDNLSHRLAEVGQADTSLGPAQEVVAIRRRLAEISPSAHLPGLAASLNNLGIRLAATQKPQEALALAQEAVTIRRRLAEADPEAHLADLAMSLRNLSARLMAVGREAEVSQIWESAIGGLTDESLRPILLAAQATYLLGGPDPGTGVELLAGILTTPGVPGPAEAGFRQLLRGHWRQHSTELEAAWQRATAIPLPGWIYLTDEQINTVIGWINSATWTDSREYFEGRTEQLTDDTTSTVLDELALTAPATVIDAHRWLLNAIRAAGVQAAYQQLLLAQAVREWLAAPSWEASRAYAEDHPELLTEDASTLLAELAEKDRSAALAIRQALLALAASPAGIDGAYRSLQDATALQATVSAAITAQDARMLQACALIEKLAYDRELAGTLHMILTWYLEERAERLPDGWGSQLQALAAQTDSAEKEAAITQLADELASIGADSALANELMRALGAPDSH